MNRCINQYVDIIHEFLHLHDNTMSTLHLIQYTHHIYCMHHVDFLHTHIMDMKNSTHSYLRGHTIGVFFNG